LLLPRSRGDSGAAEQTYIEFSKLNPPRGLQWAETAAPWRLPQTTDLVPKAKDTQLNYALDLLPAIQSVDTETKKKAEVN